MFLGVVKSLTQTVLRRLAGVCGIDLKHLWCGQLVNLAVSVTFSYNKTCVIFFFSCVVFVVFFSVATVQEGRATVNQDTRLDNRVIDLRVRIPLFTYNLSNS